MTDPRDRETDRLEEQLSMSTDPQERKELQSGLRELAMDEAGESQWLDEGVERGWF